jgi:hypothetical protein
MRPQDLLADAIDACKLLTSRYLAGFDESSRTRQAPSLPNHAAWNLGHTALTMHRVAAMLDGGPLPEQDFATASDATRFATQDVAFGSAPTSTAPYPTFARCCEIYNAACDRLARATRAATDAQIDQTVPWGNAQTTLRLLIPRMIFHNGFHTGQIADLRRAFGFQSIFA